ncbi:MAG TPA: DUF4399 domain-containing protein [Cyclobacteriaceae bacterium]|nr:DUF4399 domain-containing protein [Cyclobacteriaceae bacterium]
MKKEIFIASVVLMVLFSCNQPRKENSQNSEDTTMTKKETADSSTAETGVYFVNLKDGDKLKSPVIIQMGVHGMTVEPAGNVEEGKGHHHIIIDGTFIEKGQVVPMDKTHLHFGKGQTTDTLKLSPGEHTLTLQFANGVHDSYGEEWSKTITINVVE